MDMTSAELALAALSGASGSLSEAVVTDLWRRLRSRFSNDSQAVAALDGRDSSDPDAVAVLTEALRREAAADPNFRSEMEEWLSRLVLPASGIVNSVRDSHGLNAPGATFNGTVNMSFGSGEQAR